MHGIRDFVQRLEVSNRQGSNLLTQEHYNDIRICNNLGISQAVDGRHFTEALYFLYQI